MDKQRKQPLTKAEFDKIYSKVPRLCVEVILRSQDGDIWLAKRKTDPAKGLWYTPGGTVLMLELLTDAVKRIAAEELLITEIKSEPKMIDVIEYNFSTYTGFPISIAYEISTKQTPQIGLDGEEIKSFSKLPEHMIPEHRHFLIKHFNF